jgi:hypothetical protein
MSEEWHLQFGKSLGSTVLYGWSGRALNFSFKTISSNRRADSEVDPSPKRLCRIRGGKLSFVLEQSTVKFVDNYIFRKIFLLHNS